MVQGKLLTLRKYNHDKQVHERKLTFDLIKQTEKELRDMRVASRFK